MTASRADANAAHADRGAAVGADPGPLVTIGMPVYNGGAWLAPALESLVRQTFPSFRLVISDNASTDDTLSICQAYASRDPRIEVHRNPRNIGGFANFRAVLDRATTPYFMWAAADDQWEPSFLASLLAELEQHPGAGLAMCALELMNEHGEPTGVIRFEGADDPNTKSSTEMFLAATCPPKRKYNVFIYGLFRTQLLARALPSLPNVLGSDRMLIAHLSLASRVRYVDRPLYRRRVNSASFPERHPAEAANWRSTSRYREIGVSLRLGRMLARSSLIPWWRKTVIPLGMIGLVSLLRRTGYARALTGTRPGVAVPR